MSADVHPKVGSNGGCHADHAVRHGCPRRFGQAREREDAPRSERGRRLSVGAGRIRAQKRESGRKLLGGSVAIAFSCCCVAFDSMQSLIGWRRQACAAL